MKYVEMTTAIFNATSTDVKGKVWSSEEHMAKEASELEEKYMGGTSLFFYLLRLHCITKQYT